METQQLLDALTAHLALYHRRSSPARSPNPNPRKAILRWFSEIPLQQRRASLTVVDGAFVRVLLQMRERTRARGHGFFFLLPDVPSAADASLPALCFRRSRGLLARSSAASAWEGDVREGLLLFGSREGEGCECLLDSATVTEEFAGDVERFVEAMDGASDGRFLCGEVDGLNSAWFELDWLKDKGYYSMEAFVANRLEVALRMSWLNSKGGKKQKGGKSREKVNGLAAAAASAAAGVFWRKKGCLDWFLGLDPGTRKKMITTFLGKGAKSMAKEISRCLGLVDDKICSLKGDLDHSGSYYSSTNSYIRQHSSYCRQYHLYCDWEFPVSLVTRSSSIRASPFCTQLVELLVLQHIYTIFLAYQTNELEADHLWYSTLGSVETIFDNILLRFRGLLTVIARESMERELVENVHIALPSANISKEKVAVDIRGKKKCRNPKGSNSNSEPLGAVFSFKNPCMAERSESGLKMGRHTQKAREETEFANISKIKDVSESNKDLFMNIVGNTIADNRRTPSSRKKSKRKGATCKRSFCNGTGNAEMMSTAVMTDTMSPAIVQNEDLELIIENALPNAVSDVTIVGDNLQLEASSVDHLSFIVSAKAYSENSLDHFSYFTDESNISDRDSHKSRQAESGIPGVDVEIPSSSHFQSNTSCCGSIDGDSVRPFLKKTSDDMNSSVLRKLEFVALFAKSGDNSKVDLGSRILASEKDSINGMNSSVVQKVEPFSNADEPEDNSVVPFSIADKDNSNKEFHSSGLTSVIDPSVKPVSEHKLCKDVINDSSSMISVGGKSNEWPNINPVNLSHPNSNNLPAATDRYHLDVTYNCPNNFQPLYYAGRHIRTPCIDHGRGQMMPSLNPSASLDWPPMVKTSRLSQSVALGYDSVYNTRLQSSLCTGINNIGMQFRGASGDSELHYPGDGAGLPDYKKTFDFVDDTESSWLSEDEYDIRTTNGRDYNKFFGGGVMYWNPSDPVGTSFSRAPSHSSEDSLWAWYEADLNRAIDDMIDMPGFPPSYGASGLASPTAGKFGSSFDGIGPGSQAHTHAPVISSIEVNNKALDSQCPTAEVLDEKASGSKSAISGTVEGLKGDSLPHPILRPIVIPTSSRKGSRSELKYSHDHVSPCLPSSRRDLPRIKRPPSPVVLCVPHSPRVPPPSVNDSRKHRVFPVVRSGSSSPRNWGMRSWQKEESNPEVAQFCIDGPEVVWTSWGKKGISTNSAMQSIPSSLFQDRLIAISQLARDHDHPDVAFPLQPPETVNCPTRKSSLSMMHSFLQEEINSFCKQVGNKNQLKKPYINWAVNRVAKSLQVLWPRSRTSIFGSNATGLALPTSDVDLVVCLPPVRNLEPIKEAGILEGRNGIKETCLQHAARYLSNQEWVKNDSLKTIENTAIPLIMLVAEVPSDIALSEPNSIMENMVMISAFMGESGKVPCNGSSTLVNASMLSGSSSNGSTDAKTISLDISFKSPSHTGLQTTALVRELTEQFPASVPLALVLKQFLADRSLDRAYSGGLSSYCLVLLITRFLQHEHHIGRSLHQNLGSLLMDFLYFFGNVFDPRQMRVSIQGSGLYMNRERGHSIDPIHIDDPLCPTNNVGRNCFRIHQCIKAFADAYSILESELSLFSVEAGPSAQQPVKLLPKIIPSIGLHSQGPLEIRDMD